MQLASVTEIGEALTLQMNEMFFDDLPGTDGRKQLAALGHCVAFWLDQTFSGCLSIGDALYRSVPDLQPAGADGVPRRRRAAAVTFVLYLRPS